jgi:hypothetical protein
MVQAAPPYAEAASHDYQTNHCFHHTENKTRNVRKLT